MHLLNSATSITQSQKNLANKLNSLKHYLKPPPKLTVSEWADEYRILSMGNAESGRWRTARAPYQKEPMDCMSDPDVFRVTLMWGAQLGKTETINNGIGYHIHQNTSSQMMMHPTQGDLSTWLETKLNPLLTDTPEIAERVAKARGRDGVNNQRMKSYPGGFLMFAWSGSPNTMRGRSAPRIWCDEVDGYEVTQEGDPINLLWQRAATFGDQRQLVVTSTPTIKGFSRVEKSFDQGDQRQFYVPCPHCEEYQTLKWEQVTWQKNGEDHLPNTAIYACEHCGCEISDGHKQAMLKRGEWRAKKEFTGHASFHLSELYSPFRKWRDIATSFLEKKASGDLQSFVNVSLAETWEEEGSKLEHSLLYNRREHFKSPVPENAVVLTAAVDVQDDRFEIQIEGWGEGEENYKVDFFILRGDPSRPELWEKLDERLSERYQHESGTTLPIACTTIDSGGHYTEQVYRFVKRREVKRIYAIKGSSTAGAPIVGRPSKSNKGKINLFGIGTDTAKELIFKRLQINEPGSGYVHFPVNEAFDEEWFEQLTAEKCVTRYKEGRPQRKWIKTRSRNEALDLSVYNLAALYILSPNFKVLSQKLKAVEEVEPEPEPTSAEKALTKSEPKPKRRKSRRRGFATQW
ncbi:MAG: terminase [Alteromonas sp.]|nr:terminase [Alteromonas sp.]